MIHTIAKCDICKEAGLQLEFTEPGETILDLLDAVRGQNWRVDTLPGPVYQLRCRNCQNISPSEYLTGVAEEQHAKKRV